ncbi:hypothetical protein AYO38_11580 [bacterium SCGC AG-212-C10]|nr:hypothetical protein AYO38_11580 [bacterium SCGC AG-212-C10]
MQIEYALLADYAEIVGNKLYVMGGGWDTFAAPEAPAFVRLAIAVGVRVPWEETNQQIPIHVAIEDDDGRELGRIEGSVMVGRPAELPPGSSQLAQMAANVPLTVPAFGGYRTRISAGKDAIATLALPFRVLQRK